VNKENGRGLGIMQIILAFACVMSCVTSQPRH